MKTVTKEMIEAYVAEVERDIEPNDLHMCTDLCSEQPGMFRILDNLASNMDKIEPDVTRHFVYYVHMLYKLLKRANDEL